MIAVFVGAWAASYVAAGTARISYAGFQIAFAFFLCIIQGSGPALDLTIARDRIIGIIIGNLVAYFTFVYVRPATVSRRVDPGLATAFRQLAKVISTQGPRERQLLASQAQGTLRQIETDIDLAHYEPTTIRSSAAWLAARRQIVESSQSLGSLLLLSTDTRELSRVEAGSRLERLATRLAGPTDVVAAESSVIESTHGCQTLPAQVHRRLQALEDTLAASVVNSKANTDAYA
jgi:multidrug resistance protein MdtO